MRKSKNIKAVWDSDLETLLGNLEIWEPLLLGELVCQICGRTVDLENLGTIIPATERADVTCDDARCVHAVTNREVMSAGD